MAFAQYPQRIISGMPSITEMLYALDLEDRIVGVTSNCNYPPEVIKKPRVGGFFLNLEKIVSLKPDLVIMLESAQKQDIKRFKKFGLSVKTLKISSVDGVMTALLKIGEWTGQEKQAARLVKRLKRRVKKVAPRFFDIRHVLGRPRTLVIVGDRPLVVAGGGTFIDDIMIKAGVENIAAGTKAAYPQYSFERLLKIDPDYIIIPRGVISQKQLQRSRRWRTLTAVKKGRVLFIDADVLSRPGPRVVEAIERIHEFTNEKKI